MAEPGVDECLWQEITARAGKQFETHKGSAFTYHIKEDRSGETSGELVIDGKAKRITRSTVLLAFHRVMELQEAHGCVSKPGKIGVYGDTYLYPVFLDIGICTRTKDEKPGQLLQKNLEKAEEPFGKACSHCGYTTTEDFDFCPKCGRKFLQ